MGYGLGWFIETFNGRRIVHHGGSTGTCLLRVPADGVSVIVLTNLEQFSGSDPCAIARGVAEVYVPAISVRHAAVIADPDTARSRLLRRAIENFAQGTADSLVYAPSAYPIMKQAAAAQKAMFAQLGPLQAFDLVAIDSLGDKVLHYRARYRDVTIGLRYVLDERGRITSLGAR
jgi:hypothetical protein